MRSTKCLVVALVLFTSFPVFAQQSDASVQQGASVSAGGSTAAQSADVNAHASATGSLEMRPVAGELVEKLDSKSAKVGDAVIVKTTQKASTAEGAVIPKGSRLVGHVTEVRAHSKENEESSLAVEFDRAELKGGQSIAIHSVIESIAPPVAAASLDSNDSLGGMGSTSGGRSGGGLGGGALAGTGSLAGNAGGLAGGATRTLGAAGTATESGLGSAGAGAISAADQASGRVSADAAGGLQGAASGSGALAAHATGISGVMLAGDATGATSGTLMASRKNVHLDGGTQIVLGVSSAVTR